MNTMQNFKSNKYIKKVISSIAIQLFYNDSMKKQDLKTEHLNVLFYTNNKYTSIGIVTIDINVDIKTVLAARNSS